MLSNRNQLMRVSENAQVVLGDAETRIKNTHMHEDFYNAFLKKKFGPITPVNFMRAAIRLFYICEEVYGQNKVGIWKNYRVNLDFGSILASFGVIDQEWGEEIPVQGLTPGNFRDLFNESNSLALRISPLQDRDDCMYSFVQMEWTRARPNTIFFYGQQFEGKYRQEGRQSPIVSSLYGKMFFTPNSPPNILFSVGLGIDLYLKEKRDSRRTYKQMGRWLGIIVPKLVVRQEDNCE